MYFSFFKLKKWGKKTAAARRHNCAVLPYKSGTPETKFQLHTIMAAIFFDKKIFVLFPSYSESSKR